MIRWTRRVATIWAIEFVALVLLARWIPGLELASWWTAIPAVAVIAFLNALLRPLLLLLMMPFTMLTFGLFGVVLNAMMLLFAARIVPGFSIDGWLTALWTTLGMAAVGTLLTGLASIDDEDSYYQNVVARLSRAVGGAVPDTGPGLVVVQIDGLSHRALMRTIHEKHMPTLSRWIASGAYRLRRWDTGLPSMTTAAQAGILYGDNWDIPAFRWYEKERGRLMVSNHPADAAEIESRLPRQRTLLSRGWSLGNLLSGGAERGMLTISMLTDIPRSLIGASFPLYEYFLNPYNFSRAIVMMTWEAAVELRENLRGIVRKSGPRVSRWGFFPLERVLSTILLRDINVYTLFENIFAGVPTNYINLIGYDTVAHRAGPESPDAFRILRFVDRHLGRLERLVSQSPRPSRIVVLSDHGQSPGAPFRQRYGLTLEELVRRLLRGDRAVSASVGSFEARGYLNILVSEALGQNNRVARGARRIIRARVHGGYLRVGKKPKEPAGSVAEAGAVVCASGNLGLVYLPETEERLELERIAVLHPGLIEGLAGHPGIGFVVVKSEAHGTVVVGGGGIRHLADGRVEGRDPLAGYGPRAADHLRRLDRFPHVGDIVVNGAWDPLTGEAMAFEEQIGSHGGLGGPQTEPFILSPADWEAGDEIVGPVAVHELLAGWMRGIGLDPERDETRPGETG